MSAQERQSGRAGEIGGGQSVTHFRHRPTPPIADGCKIIPLASADPRQFDILEIVAWGNCHFFEAVL